VGVGVFPALRGEHVPAVTLVAFRVIDAAAPPEIRAIRVRESKY
jgi:hypothetical protein